MNAAVSPSSDAVRLAAAAVFATPSLCLASQSPRRSQLLTQLGVPHVAVSPPDLDDAEALEAVRAGELPRDYVQRVTQAKLQASLAHLHAGQWQAALGHGDLGGGLATELIAADALQTLPPVLCADTTVALGNTILGKPDSDAHAAEMLRAMQGGTHVVYTAVALGWRGEVWQAFSASEVTFAPMSEADVLAYVASGEPRGKAGSYGIQGLAAQFVSRISGSYTGIMGLPVFETAQLLKRAGWWR